jgi:GABA(A) receptor-associated protein
MTLTSIKQLKKKFPDRVPIIIQTSADLFLDKHKFLLPNSLTWGEFLCIVRKRLKKTFKAEEALFIFVKDTIPSSCALISVTAKENFADDEIMVCTLRKEATFGNDDKIFKNSCV